MRTTSVPENRDELLNDFNKVVTETQGLLDSMTSATTEKTAALRASLEKRLKATKERLSELQDVAVERTTAAAKATDEYVHENPWQVIGVAAGVGVVIGLMLSNLIDRR
jgi:ElaB/YqjD/DUF883 family membrane-anchored ribosome-binding protein